MIKEDFTRWFEINKPNLFDKDGLIYCDIDELSDAIETYILETAVRLREENEVYDEDTNEDEYDDDIFGVMSEEEDDFFMNMNGSPITETIDRNVIRQVDNVGRNGEAYVFTEDELNKIKCLLLKLGRQS